PMPADSAQSIIERLPANRKVGDAAEWCSMFATGTEARVTLASNDAAKDLSWFAHSTLRVSEPTDAEFLASSSGSLRVWLNGRLMHERGEPQSFRADSDRFAAMLAEGDNEVVVMVGRSAVPAELHLRFRRKSATAQHERLT